ncbi:MAG: hypothetical protein HOC71_00105 [Candidatus Latescibacteria bacterium]|jgi:hypothetical protein|nr:hypothetical protein [Candidatus Latescibacterota bacterium]
MEEQTEKSDEFVDLLSSHFPDFDEFWDEIEKAPKFSTWLISIGLAVLGFFLTVLLQIRFKSILPYKINAISAIILLILSISTGLYIRIKLEFLNFL